MARVAVAQPCEAVLAAAARRDAAACRAGQRPSAAALAAHAVSRPTGCLIAPQDLRTADATRASEIYSGRFAFAGKVVVCDGRSIFEMEPPSDEWAAALLGFGWLRHLRAAESGHHPRQCARAGRRMDRAARRLASARPGGRTCCRGASSPGSARRRWCCRTPTCASTGASCAASFARCAICATPPATRAAASRACRPSIALTYAALCIAGQARHIKSATERLKQRNRAADPARRRPCQPRSRRDHRNAARTAAAAPSLRVAQHRAAAGAAQRHRPHDADAALLPPFRRHASRISTAWARRRPICC